jgi:hypothetical protein
MDRHASDKDQTYRYARAKYDAIILPESGPIFLLMP